MNPDGYQYQQGKYFKRNPINVAMDAAAGAATGVAVARHWQATGDVKQTIFAGIRGWLRWKLYVLLVVFYGCGWLFWMGMTAVAIQADVSHTNAMAARINGHEVTPQHLLVTHDDLIADAVGFISAWPVIWFLIPLVLGTLFVRNVDRSLMRVNHWKLYRRLYPLAHLMRKFPDWTLYGMLIALPSLVCQFAEEITRQLLSG